jgi:hypothetical protein
MAFRLLLLLPLLVALGMEEDVVISDTDYDVVSVEDGLFTVIAVDRLMSHDAPPIR